MPREKKSYHDTTKSSRSQSSQGSKHAPKNSSGQRPASRPSSRPASQGASHHSQASRAPQNQASQAQAHSQHNGDTDSVRINKALADAGICSRRKAEELILAGKVFVNGVCIDNLGHKVSAKDEIRVQGQKVQRQEARSYLMLHKPVQSMCTANDPEGRETIFDILPAKWRQKRLFTVGRLDYFSEGLLLLTDDGYLAQRLAHPRYHLPKIYEVWVREKVQDEHLALMRSGMTLDEGEKLAPVQVRILHKEARSTLLEMTLHQGINRQIRRMCRDLGLTILQLTRVAQGPLELDIAAGKVRELSLAELTALRKAVGL